MGKTIKRAAKLIPKDVKKIKTETINNPEFRCEICAKVFLQHEDLIDHFMKHGSNEIDLKGNPKVAALNQIQCEWCSEQFTNLSMTIKHKYKSHRNEGNYSCKSCGSLFPLKRSLDLHMLTAHPNDAKLPNLDNHTCLCCFATFKNARALNIHTFRACSQKAEVPSSAPFFLPPASIKFKFNANNELVSVTYCHLCGIEFMLKADLQTHMIENHTMQQLHDIPETFTKCQLCFSIFANKFIYDLHEQTHKPGDLYCQNETERKEMLDRILQNNVETNGVNSKYRTLGDNNENIKIVKVTSLHTSFGSSKKRKAPK